MAPVKQYSFTKVQLSKAFEQWLKDYNEHPERFAEDYPEATKEGLSSYGKDCSKILIEYLEGK